MNDMTNMTEQTDMSVGTAEKMPDAAPKEANTDGAESATGGNTDSDAKIEKMQFGGLDGLMLRVEGLEKKLSERESTPERMSAEMSDFARFFPGVGADEIPESVWERVRGGESLAGAFALYRYACERESRRISEYNDANGRMSAGSLSGGGTSNYYSPDEVRRMSRSQIREHYDDVIESMRHWN